MSFLFKISCTTHGCIWRGMIIHFQAGFNAMENNQHLNVLSYASTFIVKLQPERTC